MNSRLIIILLLQIIAITCTAQPVKTDTAIGITAPKNISTDPLALASYLCLDQHSDQAKANAVYNWMTHNISYDVKSLKKFPRHHDKLVERTLKSKKAVCEGYAMTFTEICRGAGLKAVNIEGYAKDWIFDNGDELYIPRHMWSAVSINGKWQLFDPTWGAGDIVQSPGWWRRLRNKITGRKVIYAKNLKFKFHYDPQYFMQDPETFRLKHLPSDPLWQLTDTVMPIQIFEAGDSAITQFNEQYSKPQQNNPQLDRIATFDERQKIFEMADRAYAYNERYPSILAQKNANRASAAIEKAFTDTTVQVPTLLIKDAGTTLRKSQEYIKQQKKSFPEEYNKLKKKNKTKNQVARKYIREIKTDDKHIVSECKKYTRAANSRYNKIKKQSADAQKRMRSSYEGKLDDVEAAKIQKKAGAPELTALKDSVTRRDAKLDGMRRQIAAQQDSIQVAQKANSKRLDSLGRSISFEDSMLVNEANARIAMHDSYDEEVLRYSNKFKATKYKITDSLLKYYMANFDTISLAYEQLQKLQVNVLDIYKKDLASMEQYKKWNRSDNMLPYQYKTQVVDYKECIENYNKDLVAYAAYLKANKKLFAGLTDLTQHQLKIVAFMEKAEEKRKELEEKTIAKKQAFDLKENALQRENVQAILKKIDKLTAQLN